MHAWTSHTHTHTRTDFSHPPFSFSCLSFFIASFTVSLVSLTFLYLCSLHSCLPCCLNSSLCWSSFLSQLSTLGYSFCLYSLMWRLVLRDRARIWESLACPSLPQSVTPQVFTFYSKSSCSPFLCSFSLPHTAGGRAQRERGHG